MVALLVLCLATLFLFFRHIERTLPYPHHADEGFISGPAVQVLVKGDWHPHRLNYPSLPTYLAASAMAVGFLRAAADLEIRDVSQLGSVGYPHYEKPRVMQTARQAFAVLAVICLAMTGLSAWLAFRKPATMLLAPLILLMSPLFLRQSWTYLNVDIVGAAFVMLALTACLLGATRAPLNAAVLPGVCAGLATGSKYNLAVVIVPVLLAIGLYQPRGKLLWAWFGAVVAMIVAFVAVVPYSILDVPTFLNGVGYEVFHYASGHAGANGEPGLPQLVYYLRHLLSEFGYGAATLAALGMVLFLVSDPRRGALMLAFPVGLMWLLCSQKVHFTRNALSIQPFVAMFAALGLVVLHGWLARLATQRKWMPQGTKLSVLAGLVLMIAAVPPWRFAEHLRDRTDSRNLARTWIAEQLPYDWAIVIPSELGFDRRGLEKRGRQVKVVEMESVSDSEALNALLSDVQAPAAIMVPRWGADRRSPGQKRADALNELSRGWRVVKTFGTNDVLVNYLHPTAWGDPAFAIAILK